MAVLTALIQGSDVSPGPDDRDRDNKPELLRIESFPPKPSEQFAADLLGIEKKLFNHAYRMVRNRADAEDLVSDTIVRALRNEHKYRGPNLFNWSCCILGRLYLDLLRNRDRRIKADSIDNETFSEKGDAHGTFADFIPDKSTLPSAQRERTTLLAEEIINQIGELPTDHQNVLKLRFLDDLTPQEIAPILEIEEGTVRSRLHRAKKSLIGLLTDKGYTPETISNTIFCFLNESE